MYLPIKTQDYLYFVLDYCPGGDLGGLVVQKGPLPESSARFYIAELVLAVEHLHQLDIMYRDLKPENVLIGSPCLLTSLTQLLSASDGHIKLTDFGLSKENMKTGMTSQSFCGSPAYLSPELLIERSKLVPFYATHSLEAGKSADIYGIGAVLYELLVGTPPLFDEDVSTMFKSISTTAPHIPEQLSEDAKNLLKVGHMHVTRF